MTRCNYCDYKSIVRRAEAAGLAITKTYPGGPLGGVNVYVHPPDVVIPKGCDDEEYLAAWLMALPNHCCC